MLSQATQFTVMPVAGGLYDQHPEYIEAMMYILGEQSREDERKRNADKNKTMGPGRNQSRPRRVAGR